MTASDIAVINGIIFCIESFYNQKRRYARRGNISLVQYELGNVKSGQLIVQYV
jgi:hypothetical protein